MRIKEKFEKLRAAAIKDVKAVRNRRTVHAGTYPTKSQALDGMSLLQQIKTAAELGYEIYLRENDDQIEVYYVAKMPPEPFDVIYA